MQRGVLRWVLSRHLPSYSITISPKKLPRAPTEEPEVTESQITDVSVTLHLPGTVANGGEAAPEDTSVFPPAPVIPVTPVAKSAVAVRSKGKGKGCKKAKKAAASAAAAPTSALSELVAVSTGKKAASPSSRGIFGLDARLVVVLNTLWMLFFFVFQLQSSLCIELRKDVPPLSVEL